MASAKRAAIGQVRSFVAVPGTRLRRGHCRLTLLHGSGSTEVQVRGITMLKRQMSGRGHLDAVRTRVLHHG
jgi:hypothetical protein